MNINLTSDQKKWLEAQVAQGNFASLEEAMGDMLDERMAMQEVGDLSWAKPYIDEGLKAVAEGRVMTLEEHKARMAAHLESLK